MKEITNKIFYVGVNDRNKALFEGLWPLPNGVSYNSYLIVDEKICLIDTVEAAFFVNYIKNIQSIIGDRLIDYLVINHMEPDHSGSIALIKKYYPGRYDTLTPEEFVKQVKETRKGKVREEYLKFAELIDIYFTEDDKNE